MTKAGYGLFTDVEGSDRVVSERGAGATLEDFSGFTSQPASSIFIEVGNAVEVEFEMTMLPPFTAIRHRPGIGAFLWRIRFWLFKNQDQEWRGWIMRMSGSTKDGKIITIEM